MSRQIVRNSARCVACGDDIESRHRHDWVSCSCGGIFVDGGTDYLRRGATSWDIFQSTAQYAEPEDG